LNIQAIRLLVRVNVLRFTAGKKKSSNENSRLSED
jgi:hypothetical protein